MFEATVTRLEAVFDQMELLEKQQGKEFPDLKAWAQRMDDLYHNLEEQGHSLTHKQWRIIKRDLKAIGRISFKDLDTRFTQVCQDLSNLGDLFVLT